jgi:hypothetical protein
MKPNGSKDYLSVGLTELTEVYWVSAGRHTHISVTEPWVHDSRTSVHAGGDWPCLRSNQQQQQQQQHLFRQAIPTAQAHA